MQSADSLGGDDLTFHEIAHPPFSPMQPRTGRVRRKFGLAECGVNTITPPERHQAIPVAFQSKVVRVGELVDEPFEDAVQFNINLLLK